MFMSSNALFIGFSLNFNVLSLVVVIVPVAFAHVVLILSTCIYTQVDHNTSSCILLHCFIRVSLASNCKNMTLG